MKKKNLEQFSKEAAELLRQGRPLTGKDGVFTPLLKQVLEAALEGEMDAHLTQTRQLENNRRNGRAQKNLKSSLGAFEIFTPRDRNGTFEPQTIEKRQVILSNDLDEKVIGLYGLGMSYKDIRAHLSQMYGVDVSDGLLTSITDRVIPAVREWQARPLDRLYPVVWMDAIFFKIREEGTVITKAVYNILGLNIHGQKEVLGIYIGQQESATFWLQVLSDLKNRGVEDILIACIDNLKGFAEAIENQFPQAEVQLCVIHQIRNTMKHIFWKHQPEFLKDLKEVYKASTLELAEHHLDKLEEKWAKAYPTVIKSWRANWPRLSHYFKYPVQIRRLVYTTNTVEGYHRMIRKSTKTKGAFTSEMAVLKVIYLTTMNCQEKWVKPFRNWYVLYNQLNMYFSNRIISVDTVY